MSRFGRRLWQGLSLFIIFSLFGWVGQAQSQPKYPTRAIDIICPFGPGGATDLVDRIFAAILNKKFGVPVNVVNKPGGSTIPACLEVYSAKPDGYTLLGDCLPSASMVGVSTKNLPFKIMDRTFIGSIASHPVVMIVHEKSPIKNIQDVVNEAKKNPENFTWTSVGGVGVQDLAMRQFFKVIGVDIHKTKAISTKSGAEGATLTAGGHVVLGICSTSAALPPIKGGMVRALAISSKERFQGLPDVPTTAELGFPSVNAVQWNGASGPPKMPQHIVDIWDKAFQEMTKDPEFLAKLTSIGAVPFYIGSKEIRSYVSKEIEEVDRLWAAK